MGKIEEKILHLRSDVEELRMISDQSKIKHQTSLRYFEILEKDLDLKNKKNIEIFFKFLNEGTSSFREYLRDKIAVISKASPQNGEKLNEGLTSYEQMVRKLLKEYESVNNYKELDRKFKDQDFLTRSGELLFLSLNLKNTVEFSYDYIIDIIFFED